MFLLTSLLLIATLDPSLPVYDIERLCKEQPGATDPSYVAACQRSERRSYNMLKLDWTSLTREQKLFCIDAAEKADVGKYTMMIGYASIFVDLNKQNKGDTALRP